MGTVKINFYGICTHLLKQPEMPPHRVVLVNGEKPFTHAKLTSISLHYATIKVQGEAGGEQPLAGVSVSIDPVPPGEKPDYTEWEGRLPKLKIPGGKLDPRVVREEVAFKSAAYVDIPFGKWSTRCVQGAVVSVVTFEDLPAGTKLVLRRFGESVPYQEIDLSGDRTIDIVNASRPDDDRHFHLHFIVGGTAGIEAATGPDKVCNDGWSEDPVSSGYVSLGPGCSNSEYP
jgi:hypothetical protein